MACELLLLNGRIRAIARIRVSALRPPLARGFCPWEGGHERRLWNDNDIPLYRQSNWYWDYRTRDGVILQDDNSLGRLIGEAGARRWHRRRLARELLPSQAARTDGEGNAGISLQCVILTVNPILAGGTTR